MKNSDVKVSSGYFREKATIGLSILTGNQIDKALMKSTSHMLKAPKEKYVQLLLSASYNHCYEIKKNGLSVSKYIVRTLIKRLQTYNWVVVMKTVVVFHRLLSDGSDKIVQDICDEKNIFSPLKRFSDTYIVTFQRYFIEQYMGYLEERRISQKFIGVSRRIATPSFEEYIGSLNVELLFPIFESLLTILEALGNIKYSDQIVNNFCTMVAFEALVKDGKLIFKLLSTSMVFVLNGFEEFTVSLKKTWLNIYIRFTRAIGGLKNFFDSITKSSRVFTEEVPILRLPSEKVLRDLQLNVFESTMPDVEICTLEGIDIHKEVKPQPERGIFPVVKSQQQTASPENINGTSTESKSPLQKPIISMDELFGPITSAIAQTSERQSDINHIDPYFSLGEIPANEFPTEFPGAGWSSGVPTEWSPLTPIIDPVYNW
ncbi:unnamed protein product [Phytomonas sp. Hart1]|nr:unnamed protein product [Phytomonas sp. Hart1]|eukprot:CCW66106.1 unnamed protein product [Phytomonas sp. isolate Hart1]